MRAALALTGALTLAACATAEPNPDAKVAAGKEVICERIVPTGSNMPTTRCRTAEQGAADRDEAQKALSGGHQRGRVNR